MKALKGWNKDKHNTKQHPWILSSTVYLRNNHNGVKSLLVINQVYREKIITEFLHPFNNTSSNRSVKSKYIRITIFLSVFTIVNLDYASDIPNSYSVMPNITLGIESVRKLFKNNIPTKAGRPDKIHLGLLREISDEITLVCTPICLSSLSNSETLLCMD